VGGSINGPNDVLVAGTSTEIPHDRVADLDLSGPRIVPQELDCAEDHAWRAEPALQPVVVPECLLNRMQVYPVERSGTRALSVRVGRRQSLDGDQRGVIRLDGQHGAGFDGAPVNQHGASAALARIAADGRSGRPDLGSAVLPQR